MTALSFWGPSERTSCDLWNAGHCRYNFLVCSEAEEKVTGFHGGERVWMLVGHCTNRDGGTSVVFVSSSCCWNSKLRMARTCPITGLPWLSPVMCLYETSSTSCRLILPNQWEIMSGINEENPSPVVRAEFQALRDFWQQWSGSTTSSQEKGVHETLKG